jgi:hypothetical protein
MKMGNFQTILELVRCGIFYDFFSCFNRSNFAKIIASSAVREWSLFMGRGCGKWEGGEKRSFTLINGGGGQKSFNAEKGGSKEFLNLNTMSRVLISIITNSKIRL